MTPTHSKPASSAVRATSASVGPSFAGPPGHVKSGIWRPIFIVITTLQAHGKRARHRLTASVRSDTYRTHARARPVRAGSDSWCGTVLGASPRHTSVSLGSFVDQKRSRQVPAGAWR